MMREHKSISIADQIFDQLEHDILIGKYRRGEMLTEVSLSQKLGVSRTPVREALRRLEQEHIIEETSRGAEVIGITREDLIDMYEIRMHVEGLASYRAAMRVTDEELEKIKELLDLQRYYVEKTDTDDTDNSDSIKNIDSKFHEMLYAASGSKAFYNTLQPIHKKMIKFRKASVKSHSRARQSVEEHFGIYNALKNHDPELAQKLTVEHALKARDNIINTTKEI